MTSVKVLAFVGYAGLMLCALGILVSAFGWHSLTLPLAAIACVFAVLNTGARMADAFLAGGLTWRKQWRRRDEHPSLFWSVETINTITIVAYAAIGVALVVELT